MVSIVDQKVEKFKLLTKQDKQTCVIKIITNLRKKWNADAEKVFEYLQRLGNQISEEFLEIVYRDFENSVEEIKNQKKANELHKFEMTVSYLQKLHSREEEEKAKENPDDILKDL